MISIMNKSVVFLIVSLFFISQLFAQSDDNSVVVSIGTKQITKGEFVRIYKKNNSPESQEIKSVDEYMQMFIDFKLKVIEAESVGMDTTQSFKNELAGYRKQLAKPYFVDETIIDSMMLNAYERMKFEVRSAHILIKLPPNASPKDTLTAYNEILKLRKRALKGEDFGKLAAQFSHDTILASRGGDLGYFTAFQMVYPFEIATYTTKVGDVSMPFRTQYGYHIVNVKDKRPTKGKVKAAHIMILAQKDAPDAVKKDAHDKILKIYAELTNGKNFEEAVKEYSMDYNSARRDGDLGWFRSGDMVPEFAEAAFNLKEIGKYSEPVQTDFGWHIIKLLDKKELDPFETVKDEIRQKISYLPQSEQSKTVVMDRIKAKYNFVDYKSVADFYALIDSTVFGEGWSASKSKGINKPMFKIADKTYSQQDFAAYVAAMILKPKPMPIKEFVDFKYNEFVNTKVIEYEDTKLEQIYPEFGYLMQEYHDGILLFELTDQKVWSKAIKDTLGLKAYHEKHKMDLPDYSYGRRLDVSVYNCKDANAVKNASKLVSKKVKKAYTDDFILKTLNKTDSASVTLTLSGKYEEGKDETVDEMFSLYDAGTLKEGSFVLHEDGVKLLMLNSFVKPEPKPLSEIRGLMTAEYQNYLEKEWIKELRAKYPTKINNDVLSTIK